MTPAREIAKASGQAAAVGAAEAEGAAAWRSASGRAVDCPYRDDAGEDLLARVKAEWGMA